MCLHGRTKGPRYITLIQKRRNEEREEKEGDYKEGENKRIIVSQV